MVSFVNFRKRNDFCSRIITDNLGSISLRMDMSSLCVVYRLYNGENFKELSDIDIVPSSQFYHRTTRHWLGFYLHHSDAFSCKTICPIWLYVAVIFIHIRIRYGTIFRSRFFRKSTIRGLLSITCLIFRHLLHNQGWQCICNTTYFPWGTVTTSY